MINIFKKTMAVWTIILLCGSVFWVTVTQGAEITENYSYDQLGRLTKVTYKDAENTSAISYSYNVTDNIVKAILEEKAATSSLLLLVLPAIISAQK